MDRDRRWERVVQAYEALTLGKGRPASSSAEAIQNAYANGETDEFVIPTVIMENDQPVATIENEDAVIFFNFRADRARELSWAFLNDDFDGFPRVSGKLDLCFITMTQYDQQLNAPYAV